MLIGGGGHATVVADAVRFPAPHASPFPPPACDVVGVIDDNPACALVESGTAPHAGVLTDAITLLDGDETIGWHLAIGLGPARERAALFLAGMAERALAVRHPSAIVSPHARVEPGSFCAAGAVVNAGAHIAHHAIANTGAVIEHDCELAEGVHVAPGAVLGGSVRVGAWALVGLGARVMPGITIGAYAVVGAGAVVTRDVPDDATVVGVPAVRR